MGLRTHDIFLGGTSLCVIPGCGAASHSRASSASPAVIRAASRTAASAARPTARAASAASALTARPAPAAPAVPAAARAAPVRSAARRRAAAAEAPEALRPAAAASAAAVRAAAAAAAADPPFISHAPFGALTWYLRPVSAWRRAFCTMRAQAGSAAVFSPDFRRKIKFFLPPCKSPAKVYNGACTVSFRLLREVFLCHAPRRSPHPI